MATATCGPHSRSRATLTEGQTILVWFHQVIAQPIAASAATRTHFIGIDMLHRNIVAGGAGHVSIAWFRITCIICI
jgi:hypothetical protein